MPSSIEAQGATVEEAIQIALNNLGTSRDKVEIEIVHHPRGGFLGIGARRAKVRATLREGVMVDGEEFDMSKGRRSDGPRRRRGNRRDRDERGGESGGGRGRGDRDRGKASQPSGGSQGEGDRSSGGRRGRGEGRRNSEDSRSGEDRRERRDGRDVRDGRSAGRGRGSRGDADGNVRSEKSASPSPQAERNENGRTDTRAGGAAREGERTAGSEEGRGRGRRRGGRGRGGRGQKSGIENRSESGDGSSTTASEAVERTGSEAAPVEQAPSFDTQAGMSAAAAVAVAPADPTVRDERPAAPAAASEGRPQRQREEAPIDLPALGAAAESLAREMLEKMGFEAEVSSRIDEAEGEAVIQARCEAEGLLIGRRGQTLDALEHILNRMAVRADSGGEARVLLDIGEYRARRCEALAELAERLKQRALAEGRNVQVSPMSPRDRKFFQQSLASDPRVEARSLGAGFYRRVVVVPRDGASADVTVDPTAGTATQGVEEQAQDDGEA
jgi:spoIIIJ-associated protein